MSSSNENDFMVGELWLSQHEVPNVLNGPGIRKVENHWLSPFFLFDWFEIFEIFYYVAQVMGLESSVSASQVLVCATVVEDNVFCLSDLILVSFPYPLCLLWLPLDTAPLTPTCWLYSGMTPVSESTKRKALFWCQHSTRHMIGESIGVLFAQLRKAVNRGSRIQAVLKDGGSSPPGFEKEIPG